MKKSIQDKIKSIAAGLENDLAKPILSTLRTRIVNPPALAVGNLHKVYISDPSGCVIYSLYCLYKSFYFNILQL